MIDAQVCCVRELRLHRAGDELARHRACACRKGREQGGVIRANRIDIGSRNNISGIWLVGNWVVDGCRTVREISKLLNAITYNTSQLTRCGNGCGEGIPFDLPESLVIDEEESLILLYRS